MQTLDWGQITPESVNLETGVCTHVYNHDLTSLDKVDRTIRFILGRLLYYDVHLPPNMNHSLKLDVRDQIIDHTVEELINQQLKSKYQRPNSLFIDFVKH